MDCWVYAFSVHLLHLLYAGSTRWLISQHWTWTDLVEFRNSWLDSTTLNSSSILHFMFFLLTDFQCLDRKYWISVAVVFVSLFLEIVFHFHKRFNLMTQFSDLLLFYFIFCNFLFSLILMLNGFTCEEMIVVFMSYYNFWAVARQ